MSEHALTTMAIVMNTSAAMSRMRAGSCTVSTPEARSPGRLAPASVRTDRTLEPVAHCAHNAVTEADMSRLLVHLSTGPENPTRAALALLVAKSALAAGHEVDIFFAGDAVQLLRDPTMDATQGIGTGSLREHFDALAAGSVRMFASGASSKARAVDADALGGKQIEFATPDQLVALAFEADRVLSY